MTDRFSEAMRAFADGEYELAVRLVKRHAEAGDVDAQSHLGTFNMLGLECFDEAERWLRLSADAGHGSAAHNLAILYKMGWPCRAPDHRLFLQYMQIAFDSGFEATVASDPLWWKRP